MPANVTKDANNHHARRCELGSPAGITRSGRFENHHAAAVEVEHFFEPRVAELTGGPRNLAGAVEAISLCAKKAVAHRPGVEQAFGSR